jgi:hypothetical protein
MLCRRPGTQLLLPGSGFPQTPVQADGWIAGTSPAMTVAAELSGSA